MNKEKRNNIIAAIVLLVFIALIVVAIVIGTQQKTPLERDLEQIGNAAQNFVEKTKN